MTVPFRLARRPRDVRGYVVPWVQFISDDGTPNFKVLDDRKTAKALRRRLCGLCGQPMRKHVYFIGGPLCVDHRIFYDPPMHRECAVYAMTTCPHLARSKGRYGPTPEIPGIRITVGGMVTTQKAERFALMQATAYDHSRDRAGMLVVKAAEWLNVEWWKDGQPEGEGGP